MVSGLDGIDRGLRAGEPTTDPYGVDAPRLANSLTEAIDAFADDAAFAERLRQDFVDYIVHLKRFEVSRYLTAVSDWEQREHFELF